MNGKVLISGENGSYKIDYSSIPQTIENALIRLIRLVGAGRFELRGLSSGPHRKSGKVSEPRMRIDTAV